MKSDFGRLCHIPGCGIQVDQSCECLEKVGYDITNYAMKPSCRWL